MRRLENLILTRFSNQLKERHLIVSESLLILILILIHLFVPNLISVNEANVITVQKIICDCENIGFVRYKNIV